MWLKLRSVIFIGSLLFLSYLVFLKGLGDYTIRMWDEGRNGVNALEMTRKGNPIVTYFEGKPDWWNTKPPLMIWLVSMSFKMFGVSEWSLRLPSALAATGIVLGMYFFGAKVLGSSIIGWFSGIILMTTMGFSDMHIGRTGDYDALLTLWVTLAWMAALVYLKRKRDGWLGVMWLCWALAVMTKSVAGVFNLPMTLVFLTLVTKGKVWREKGFWVGGVLFLILTGGYYLVREIVDPGYLKVVWSNELFSRFKTSKDTVSTDFWYYWNFMKDFRLQKWIVVFPFVISGLIWIKGEKRWTLAMIYLLGISYFLIISFSATKQLWYDAQIYPLVSMGVALFVVETIKLLPWWLWLFPIMYIGFYTQRYLRTNIAYIERPDLYKDFSCIKYGYVWRNSKSGDMTRRSIWVEDEPCEPTDFYATWGKIRRQNSSGLLNSGDLVMSCNPKTVEELKKKYTLLEKEKVYENCAVYKVNTLNGGNK